MAVDDPVGRAAQLLEVEPHSVRAHELLGEYHQQAGDNETAIYHYRKAIEFGTIQDLPEGDLATTRAILATLLERADAVRTARLESRNLPNQKRGQRLAEALDIAAGRRAFYPQDPTTFRYPGLPTIQFFDPESFEWAADIEAATPAIREEYERIAETGTDNFRPYIQRQSIAQDANKELLDNPNWSVLPLCENGFMTPEVIDCCPITWSSVLKVPVPRISGWGPTIVFSVLKAGARIAAHNGMFNTRLICHLPLIVPEGCGFRVGNEVREWEPGKLLIFDDTIEHEAWNESDQDRVILIFDIWRPELSDAERFELLALFSD